MFWYRSHSHRHHPLRRRAATALLALVALVLWAATAAPVQAQPPPGGLVSFTYTGAAQTWTVPPGVTRATFHVSGAQGGDSFNGQGGFGRQATATLMVTPGDTITIVVGGRGGNFSCSPPAMGGAGGFNGGGAGGRGGFCSGAGGGGASDVRIGDTDLDHRVLVAGGGGGGALNHCHGGDGGNPTGVQGGCAGGGSGGNQDGTSGSGRLGQGSAGTDSNGDAFPGNGGGGGGYYGGAGGTALSNPRAAAGGGGGSSFGPAGTSFEGRRQANGVVIIIYRVAQPTVTSISPTSGPAAGGTVVTITGTGFDPSPGATSVAFGGTPATGVSCASSTTCTATSPAGSGTVGVRVTVVGQTSPDTPADDFTYVAAPTLTALNPAQGPAAGGTSVTLTGNGFDPAPGATSVRFGSSVATSVSCSNATTCTATSPAGSGTVDVTVTTLVGTSNGVPFTYITPPPPPPTAPTVTGISPISGPAAGGTVVTITGTGFSTTPGATAVMFGGAPATSITCASATQCTAISPPGNGTASVRVTVAGRTSPATPAAAFTYVPVPPPPPLPPAPPSPPQPMTLTVQVWRVLPPLVSEAQIAQTVVPVGRAAVQARIGDTLCGTGVTDGQGRAQLTVAADPPARGCGREGALVTFRVNGQPIEGSAAFVAGGSTMVTLRLP